MTESSASFIHSVASGVSGTSSGSRTVASTLSSLTRKQVGVLGQLLEAQGWEVGAEPVFSKLLHYSEVGRAGSWTSDPLTPDLERA